MHWACLHIKRFVRNTFYGWKQETDKSKFPKGTGILNIICWTCWITKKMPWKYFAFFIMFQFFDSVRFTKKSRQCKLFHDFSYECCWSTITLYYSLQYFLTLMKFLGQLCNWCVSTFVFVISNTNCFLQLIISLYTPL